MRDDLLARVLNVPDILGKKSLFLFGPRQTGKTSLIRAQLPGVRSISLLDSDMFLKLARRPSILREIIQPMEKEVVIDEIQKLPELLDEVHFAIEERGIRFLLTGSSTRKLRRGGVNLLGGRARSRNLHPFVSTELGEKFDLLRCLNFGTIPSIYLSDSPAEDLRSYCGDYLRTEIAEEGLSRNISAFSRFLEVAAVCNSQIINHSKIASDAQVARTTVIEYFEILRDTLLGYDLPSWQKTVKRKAVATNKFYFFDIGVARALKSAPLLNADMPNFGEELESFIFHELRAYTDYYQKAPLCYWRSQGGYEVDFIFDDAVAIEVKSTRHVGDSDLKGLRALLEEKKIRDAFLVCREAQTRHVDGVKILSWQEFLRMLWAHELV